MGGSSTGLGTTGTQFLTVGRDSVDATEANVQQIISVSGTATAMRVHLGTAPGGGASRVFTLRKNGASQADITVVVADPATDGVDTGSVAFVAGDLISVQSQVIGTPAASEVSICIAYVV